MRDQNGLVGSAIVGVALAIVLGAAAFVILGSPGAVPRSGTTIATASNSTDPVYIDVVSGDTAADIGKRLQDAHIIASASSFKRLATMTGVDAHLAAGEYEFEPGTSALDALVRIRDGLTAARIVTIPEGMRIEQVAELLQQRGIVSADDFLAAANSIASTGSQIDADLLSDRPTAATLEGYIFPATYSFDRNVTADQVVLMMLQALSDRFTPQLRQEARNEGLNLHQVLTLASIVQREDVLPEEMPVIASVYLNRLAIDMPLQADPTVQYALTARPGDVQEYGWWKKALSLDDLKYDSSYNTYVDKGLPPGPIANPGMAAIMAVIHPAKTNYLYFVARNDGSHAFAETFEQHEANVQKYQP